MPGLQDWQDAFGHEMVDYLHGKGGYEIIERDDGLFSTSGGPALYFGPYEEWLPSDREALKYVQGRVLDVGCGAGRHALYLQEQGFDVVGIDSSPLAIQVCRERGLRDARVLPVTQVSSQIGTFDTILMLGNNFGLVGNPKRARWLLRRFRNMTPYQGSNKGAKGGRIVAQTLDPYRTDLPEHLEYHESNRQRGRMGGQVRIRVRYKKYVTPWIEFLIVSKEEMAAIVEGTGWEIRTFIDDDKVEAAYVAVMEKE